MSVLAMRDAIDRGGVVRYQTLNGCEVWGEWYCKGENLAGLDDYCTLVRQYVVGLWGSDENETDLRIHMSNEFVTGTTYVSLVWADKLGTMQCIDLFLGDMRRAFEPLIHPVEAQCCNVPCFAAVKMRYDPDMKAHILVSDTEWESLASSLRSMYSISV
jgi:hypothetical protein